MAALSLDEWREAIRSQDRRALARAITLVESTHPDHRHEARGLLAALPQKDLHLPMTLKLAVSGPPGAGKSTLIEALGSQWLDRGERVAVLSVDPSSDLNGGSLLADKTRMPQLAAHPEAFVRPSASGGMLGGTHRRSREVMVLLEYAGFRRIILETVGVGQSESDCARMVDLLCVLQLTGAGDELQALKKGLHEHADILCIHKADDPQSPEVLDAVRMWQSVVRMQAEGLRRQQNRGATEVKAVSSHRSGDVKELLEAIELRHRKACASGELLKRRSMQALNWFQEECQVLMEEVLQQQRKYREFLQSYHLPHHNQEAAAEKNLHPPHPPLPPVAAWEAFCAWKAELPSDKEA